MSSPLSLPVIFHATILDIMCFGADLFHAAWNQKLKRDDIRNSNNMLQDWQLDNTAESEQLPNRTWQLCSMEWWHAYNTHKLNKGELKVYFLIHSLIPLFF